MSRLFIKVATQLADEDMLADVRSEHHNDHRLANEFKATGIHEAPCIAPWCKKFDKGHAAKFDEAEDRALGGEGHTEHLDLSKPLHGFEARADVPHIIKNMHDPGMARRHQPLVFRSGGQHYIMDGHHALAGALLRGSRTHPVRMVDLDKED